MQRTGARTEIHTPSHALANINICYQFYTYFSAYNYTLLHVLQYWSVINVLTQHTCTCICLCKFLSFSNFYLSTKSMNFNTDEYLWDIAMEQRSILYVYEIVFPQISAFLHTSWTSKDFFSPQISTFPQNPWTSILITNYQLFQCTHETYLMFA